LLEEVANRCLAGEPVDWSAYERDYPQYVEELRQLMPAMRAVADFSRSAREGDAAPVNEHNGVEGTLGDFRILRELGRGGMGVVYEAEQISLGRRVALKVLPFAATMDPRHLQRFQNEARAAASLEHPHIVPVYGVGCERGVHYYAMKFIDGQSLAEIIAAQRTSAPRTQPGGVSGGDEPLTPLRSVHGSESTSPVAALNTQRSPRDAAAFRQIAEWGIQAAEALEYAHSLGIVHRDIKPANLMIDGQGSLWITDFGLARTAADAGLTMTGDVLGTLRYMSPEQALAKHGLVDHRTDVYSLGVTLYELLTGRSAVEGKDREEILNRITLNEPQPPRGIDVEIPRDLETVVLKALAKSPVERYATARELADDLRRFAETRPVQAKRPTMIKRFSHWCRRHQGVVWAGGAGLLLAATIMAVSSFLLWRQNEQITQTLAEKNEEFERAEQQLQRAEDNFQKAIYSIAGFFDKLDEWRDVPNMKRLRRSLRQHLEQYFLDYFEKNRDDLTLRRETATVLMHLGILHRRDGDLDLALANFLKAKAILEERAEEGYTDAGYVGKRAEAYEYVASETWFAGRIQEATELYRRGVELQHRLIELQPWADHYNELAAHLCVCPIPEVWNLPLALSLAKEAVRLAPESGGYWNTLGWAQYRSGALHEAIAALNKSMELRKGGDCDDFFFLAMAHAKLGDRELAQHWYDRGVKHMQNAQPVLARWPRFRAEAAQVLGIQEQPKPPDKPPSTKQ
jgi:serine/threonine protein kinase